MRLKKKEHHYGESRFMLPGKLKKNSLKLGKIVLQLQQKFI